MAIKILKRNMIIITTKETMATIQDITIEIKMAMITTGMVTMITEAMEITRVMEITMVMVTARVMEVTMVMVITLVMVITMVMEITTGITTREVTLNQKCVSYVHHQIIGQVYVTNLEHQQKNVQR